MFTGWCIHRSTNRIPFTQIAGLIKCLLRRPDLLLQCFTQFPTRSKQAFALQKQMLVVKAIYAIKFTIYISFKVIHTFVSTFISVASVPRLAPRTIEASICTAEANACCWCNRRDSNYCLKLFQICSNDRFVV